MTATRLAVACRLTCLGITRPKGIGAAPLPACRRKGRMPSHPRDRPEAAGLPLSDPLRPPATHLPSKGNVCACVAAFPARLKAVSLPACPLLHPSGGGQAVVAGRADEIEVQNENAAAGAGRNLLHRSSKTELMW